jgi:hypothetical protein
LSDSTNGVGQQKKKKKKKNYFFLSMDMPTTGFRNSSVGIAFSSFFFAMLPTLDSFFRLRLTY